jgi:antitoxin ParD1/3/4
MVINLPPDLDAFVHQQIEAGRYESVEMVIIAALRLLQEHERKLEELRAELRPALESLDRGEGIPLDMEDIIRRGRARLAAEGKLGSSEE